MAVIWMGTGRFAPAYDTDAQAYITAVEAADTAAGQSGGLETATKDAINAFVVGCKADGTWSAIKASCILAGARTLNGCLRPLVGAAPTNFNFVAGDYNRETGLKGNGSTKYLDSTYAFPQGLQNDAHVSIYVSTAADANSYIGAFNGLGGTQIVAGGFARLNSGATAVISNFSTATGLVGVNRGNASQIATRISNSSTVVSNASATVIAQTIHVFQRNFSTSFNPTAARFAFYSIGESLDLALLDARVTTLINAIAAAIP